MYPNAVSVSHPPVCRMKLGIDAATFYPMFPFPVEFEISKPRCKFPIPPICRAGAIHSYEHAVHTHSNQLATNNTNAKIPAFESGCDIWAPDTAAAKLELTNDGPQLTFTCIAAET